MSEQGTPKKGGCLKGCLIFVLVIVVVVVGAGVGGYMFFRSQVPDQVEYEANDVESFYDKLGIKEENYQFTLQELLSGQVESEGMVPVDVRLTSEELTGFLQTKSGDSGSVGGAFDLRNLVADHVLMLPVMRMSATSASGSFLLNDYNVRITGPDEMELFASVTEDLSAIYDLVPDLDRYSTIVDRAAGAMLYCKMNITYSQSSGFYIDILKLSVNGVPAPENMVNDYEPDLMQVVNDRLAQTDMIVIEEFRLEADGLVFRGEIPESIRSMNR